MHVGDWRSLYRIRTSHLLDPLLHPDDLANLVERFGDKPISDGITIDGGGHVYVTVNQLQHSPALNQGTDTSTPPYYLLRFPTLDAGVVGR